MRFIIDHGFKKLKLNKLYLDVFVANTPAVKLYKSVGFKEEGLLKEHGFVEGKFLDELVMALLNK
jgi:diamine N-acetyltransferase